VRREQTGVIIGLWRDYARTDDFPWELLIDCYV